MSNNEAPFTNVRDLLRFLSLTERGTSPANVGKPLLVPRSFVRRMQRGDPRDPLLLQVLPSEAERQAADGDLDDPVGDDAACIEKGLLQKYNGRALLTVTDACSLHCRFCFRRNRPPERFVAGPTDVDNAMQRLRHASEIRELILSGGDPLTAPLSLLERLVFSINASPQLMRVRIHTRVPTADPARISATLMRVLSQLKVPLTVIWHTNHPQELNDETAAAADLLKEITVCRLNQTVLLRGVNDSPDVLIALSEKLVSQGILPYYLHQLDRATGTRHFEVPVEKGRAIMDAVRAACSGYLVPRYVREIPGEPSKTPL